MKQPPFRFPLILSVVLFLCIASALYPLCKFYIDPDATAYLSLIEEFAAGNYARAFNGLWSSLPLFLSGLIFKYTSFNAFQSALMVQALASLGIIVLSFSIFRYYQRSRTEYWFLALFSAPFWAIALYFQLVADQMGVFLFLLVFRLFLSCDQNGTVWKWPVMGFLTGLLVYTKTYNAYALILILFLTQAYGFWKNKSSFRVSFQPFLAFLGIFILAALPLLWLTHWKYGIWGFGTAGKLNMDWYTVGQQTFRADATPLISPIYPNSVSYWEDPFWVQDGWHSFLSSPQLFLRYLFRLGNNLLEWIREMNHLSFAYALIWISTLILFVRSIARLKGLISIKDRKLMLAILWFPLGLLLVHIEARYLWPVLILAILFGLIQLERWLFPHIQKRLRTLVLALFWGSFLVGSFFDLKSMVYTGKAEYEMAQEINQLGIKGAFFTNWDSGNGHWPGLLRIAYFSGNPLYAHTPATTVTMEQLIQSAIDDHVPYFYYFYEGTSTLPIQFSDANGQPYPEMTGGKIAGLLIFKIGDPSEIPKVVIPHS